MLGKAQLRDTSPDRYKFRKKTLNVFPFIYSVGFL